jgi:hypothetical protein
VTSHAMSGIHGSIRSGRVKVRCTEFKLQPGRGATEALRSSARSLAQGVSPGNTRTKTASPGRATERRRISAARSGLQHAVTINLALTRQAKILLPLRGSRMSKLEWSRSDPLTLARRFNAGTLEARSVMADATRFLSPGFPCVKTHGQVQNCRYAAV